MSKTKRKAIKNYTTTISVDKTISEIESLLAKCGAKKILKEYDDDQNVITLTFMVKEGSGFIPIRLPSDPDKVVVMINEKVDSGDIPRKYRNDREQACRIMWRVILDWIDSQMTMIQIGQRSLLQIFFADVCQVGVEDTLYDKMLQSNMKGYRIEKQ